MSEVGRCHLQQVHKGLACACVCVCVCVRVGALVHYFSSIKSSYGSTSFVLILCRCLDSHSWQRVLAWFPPISLQSIGP